MKNKSTAGKVILSGGAVYLKDRVLSPGSVVVEDGAIKEISEGASVAVPDGYGRVDCSGRKIVPGFIDIHVHGINGIDTNEADADAFVRFSSELAARGVTSFLPTTLACSPSRLGSILAAVRAAKPRCSGADIIGVHLESNFISTKFKGAQPEENIFTPQDGKGAEVKALIAEYRDIVRIVTLAPEIKGGIELVRWLSDMGISVSLGHSSATYEEGKAGIEAGARQATHLFNAMPPLHHRNPGLVGAVLENGDVFAEVVCDGLHVHPALLRTVMKAKGPGKMLPVSDALKGSGMGHGCFEFGGRTVRVENGYARLEDGTIAGSVTTMAEIIRTLSSAAGFRDEDIFRMVAGTPAESLGLQDRGYIRPGARADIVILDGMDVKAVMCRGTFVTGA